MRGRPPKPTETLKIQGTYKDCRHANRLDLQVLTELPPPPSDLGPAQKEHWVWITTELNKQGILVSTDLSALRCYVNAYIEYVECEQYYVKYGHTKALLEGKIDAMHKASDTLLKWTDRLGLSPVARARIHIQKKAEKGGVQTRQRTG